MKALGYVIGGLTWIALGFAQWIAEVDGLHQVLGWPKFFCVLAASFTAWIPVLGTAAGIWGAHAAWGWDWLPAFALFLGPPLLMLVVIAVVMAVAAAVDAIRARRARSAR